MLARESSVIQLVCVFLIFKNNNKLCLSGSLKYFCNSQQQKFRFQKLEKVLMESSIYGFYHHLIHKIM